MSQRKAAENLDKIMKEVPKVCLTRDIPPGQGASTLIQVGCP